MASVTRIAMKFAQPVEPGRVLVAEGEISNAQLKEVTRNAPSQALALREVKALSWIDGNDPALLVVAPLRPLEPGVYGLAVGGAGVVFPFVVAADAVPVITHVWPPTDKGAVSADFAAWCGERELPPLDREISLDPAGRTGRLQMGVGAQFAVPQCISWSADAPAFSREIDAGAPEARDAAPNVADTELPALAPPSVTFDDQSLVAIEPSLLMPVGVPAPPDSVQCGRTEVRFGPACAEVQDDRILLRPPLSPLLWAIDGAGSAVRISSGGRRFVVRPIPMGGKFRLTTVDRTASRSTHELVVQKGPPRTHLVLNEVLPTRLGRSDNKNGSSSITTAPMRSTWTATRSKTKGPRGGCHPRIGSGGFALLVPANFVWNDGLDPVPAANTLVVRLPDLGKAGLSNAGEPLVLRGPTGAVASRFPASKTRNGVSIARLTPDALDEDPASFASSTNGSSTPGAPNAGP